jgi:hypothetical protein
MYDYDRRITASVLLRDLGDAYEVSGSYNELRDVLKALKSQGWRCDPSNRVWTIAKSRLTQRKLLNIKNKLHIQDNEAPDSAAYEEVVRALAPITVQKVPGGILVYPVGVDFRVYKGEWFPSEASWFLSPTIDSKTLVKDLPKVLTAIKTVQNTSKALSALKSDQFLTVYVGRGRVTVGGPATYLAREYLKGLGFAFKNRVWGGSLAKIKNPQEFLKVLEKSRTEAKAQAEEKAQERAQERVQRGREPASDKQKALLKDWAVKYRSDWFDITDGIGDMRPPTPQQIDTMSKGEASALIQMVMDWKRY